MRIWPWSVIADLRDEVEHLNQYTTKLERTMDAQRSLLSRQGWVIQSGIGHIIAKIDPLFGIPDDDPQRIADSKRLEQNIIDKLTAEYDVLKSRNLLP